ncbi:MAG: hypothetical protein ABIL52_02805 [candidate division WOR-3 bacterium]
MRINFFYFFISNFIFISCSKSYSDSCQDVNFSYFVSTDPADSSYNKRAKNVIVKVIDSKNNIIMDTTDTLGRFNIVGNLCFPYKGRVEMGSQASSSEGCKSCHYPGGNANSYIYILP